MLRFRMVGTEASRLANRACSVVVSDACGCRVLFCATRAGARARGTCRGQSAQAAALVWTRTTRRDRSTSRSRVLSSRLSARSRSRCAGGVWRAAWYQRRSPARRAATDGWGPRRGIGSQVARPMVAASRPRPHRDAAKAPGRGRARTKAEWVHDTGGGWLQRVLADLGVSARRERRASDGRNHIHAPRGSSAGSCPRLRSPLSRLRTFARANPNERESSSARRPPS